MLSSPKAEDDEDSIHTEIDYLAKDPKHEHEKPYEIRYDTGGLIPERNMVSIGSPCTDCKKRIRTLSSNYKKKRLYIHKVVPPTGVPRER